MCKTQILLAFIEGEDVNHVATDEHAGGTGKGNVHRQDRSKSLGSLMHCRQRNGLTHMPELLQNWPQYLQHIPAARDRSRAHDL